MNSFSFPLLALRNLVVIGPDVSLERSFKIVDGRTTAGPAYPITPPGAFSLGELKHIVGLTEFVRKKVRKCASLSTAFKPGLSRTLF